MEDGRQSREQDHLSRKSTQVNFLLIPLFQTIPEDFSRRTVFEGTVLLETRVAMQLLLGGAVKRHFDAFQAAK